LPPPLRIFMWGGYFRSSGGGGGGGWGGGGGGGGVGELFRTRPDRPWSPPFLLYNGYQVFPGGKVVKTWCWSPTPSSTEVKESVVLYIYSPSGPSWPVLVRALLYMFANFCDVISSYLQLICRSKAFLCKYDAYLPPTQPGTLYKPNLIIDDDKDLIILSHALRYRNQ